AGAGADRGRVTAVGARDRRATASGQERWGDWLAWRRGGHGLFERAKAGSEAPSAAQEGSGGRGRGSDSGLRNDAPGRETREPDVRDFVARRIDAAVSGGVAGDGGNGGGLAVECEPGSSRGQRGRTETAVRAAPRRREPAGHLSGWEHLWRPSRPGGGGRGRGRKEERPGISRGRQ